VEGVREEILEFLFRVPDVSRSDTIATLI